MSHRIFALGNDGELAALDEAAFDLEDALQRMVADYPELLAGEQISEADPRRWLLVTREAGVPHYTDASDTCR